jgi:hypothetical protein
MLLTNNGRMLGGAGGVLLAILGSILIGNGGGLLLVGLIALLAGVTLVVRTLLGMAEASVDGGGKDHSGASTRLGPLVNLEGVKHMSTANQWIAGILMGVLALLGLFLFSRAGDGMFALFGGVLFLFGLGAIVVFVHQATDYSSPVAPADEVEAAAAEERRPAA